MKKINPLIIIKDAIPPWDYKSTYLRINYDDYYDIDYEDLKNAIQSNPSMHGRIRDKRHDPCLKD